MKYSIWGILVCVVLGLLLPHQASGQKVHSFGEPSDYKRVVFSPDGKFLVSNGWDVKMWNIEKKAVVDSFETMGSVLDISPDGKYLVFEVENHNLEILDLKSGKTQNIINLQSKFGEFYSISHVAFTPDGNNLFTAINEKNQRGLFVRGELSLWSIDTGEMTRSFGQFDESITGAAVSPKGKYVLTTVRRNDKPKLWKMSTGNHVRTFQGGGPISFSPDGKYLTIGEKNPKNNGPFENIALWNVKSGNHVRTLTEFGGEARRYHETSLRGNLYNIAFSPDSKYIFSQNFFNEVSFVRLWNVSSGLPLGPPRKVELAVMDVAFSPDGEHVAIATSAPRGTSDEGELSLWKTETFKLRPWISLKVKKQVEEWQQQGKYESTSEYRERITTENRREKIKELKDHLVDSLGINRYFREWGYEDTVSQFRAKTSVQKDYDADNETFKITLKSGPQFYLQVPLEEAKSFDKNLTVFSDLDFVLTKDNEFELVQATLINSETKETYEYKSSKKLAYNTVDLDMSFAPINFGDSESPEDKKAGNAVEVGQADVDTNIPETDVSRPNAIAVVIGNRNYQGDTPNVDFATNDARTVKQYLVKTLGFKPGNILYKENATRNEMVVLFGNEKQQGKLSEFIKPGESEVFVFYSGHGAPDPNTDTGYLMPTDANANALSLTGYSLNTLYESLSNLNAKSVNVVIDACFSGATKDGGMLIQNASPIGIEVENPASKLEDGFVVTASSGSQVASWHPEKKHGLLTYFWLKGLQGEADLNDDQKVTTSEMQQYLTDPTDGLPYWARRLHNRDQMPQVFGSDGNEVIVQYN